MISRVAERPNIFILHNQGQARFSSLQLPDESLYPVWTPPTYDPHTFSQNSVGDAYTASVQRFEAYNALIPAAVNAAKELVRALAAKLAPKATVYPLPNFMATDTITLLTPLDEKKPEADAVLEAESAAESLRQTLEAMSPQVTPSASAGEFQFKDSTGAEFKLVVGREETESERWLLDGCS